MEMHRISGATCSVPFRHECLALLAATFKGPCYVAETATTLLGRQVTEPGVDAISVNTDKFLYHG